MRFSPSPHLSFSPSLTFPYTHSLPHAGGAGSHVGSPKGKKPAHLIRSELKVLEEDLRTEAAHAPAKRALIGDKEKSR